MMISTLTDSTEGFRDSRNLSPKAGLMLIILEGVTTTDSTRCRCVQKGKRLPEDLSHSWFRSSSTVFR